MPNSRLLPAILLLLVAIAAVFGQTLRFDFVNLDDTDYVVENDHVRPGLTAQCVAWAFTHRCVSNWHPLTMLSHMADCQFYGLRPAGHHATSVVLHAATAVLLLLVLWKITGVLGPSAFAAALFALHPLRAESVAWIAERKDVLSGVCFMLTLAAYVHYTRRPGVGRYLGVVAFFALGLMAKPMLVSVPLLLLLLDYWPLARFSAEKPKWRRLLLEKAPLAVLAAASCVVTLLAQSDAIMPIDKFPLHLRLASAVVAYAIYLRQMVWPVGLAAFYPLDAAALTAGRVSGAALLLVAITVAAVAVRRRCPYVLVGWLWYLVALVPVIGIVQVGVQAMADRYTYLPMIGPAIALAWGAADLVRSRRLSPAMVLATAGCVLAVLMGMAWRQTSYWRNSRVLWTHTIACTTSNFLAHNNLGRVLADEGDMPGAAREFAAAVEARPDDAMQQHNLGRALRAVGRLPEAVDHLRQAEKLAPKDPTIHESLGSAYAASGDMHRALAQFEEALRIAPRFVPALRSLAWLLAVHDPADGGDPARAVKIVEDSRARTGTLSAGGYDILAAAYASQGRYQEAVTAAKEAISLATAAGQTTLVKSIQSRLALYEQGKPYRESPASVQTH